jgi:glycosyltransferase involved in cell wall biosynthesis
VRELWILHDARIYGGGEGNVFKLASFIETSLPDRSVRVVCPGDSELAARCRAASIRVIDARFPDLEPLGALQIARAVHRLRRVLRDAGRDVLVVAATLRSQVYAHAATFGMRRAPMIVHLLAEQDSARRLTTRLMLHRFGAVVVIGENAARTYRERLAGTPVTVANTFLLEEEFTDAAKQRRLHEEGAPVLGVLARLIPEKGVLELVGELAEAPASWARAIVGGTREDERYARAIEERLGALGFAERVRLLGNVEDLGAFFGEIDVLVVPSVGNEGQPTVIVEALAHGIPAIVRQPIWSSEEFKGLPVVPYRNASDLERVLGSLERSAIDGAELVERFGPRQMLDALEAAGAQAGSEWRRRVTSS